MTGPVQREINGSQYASSVLGNARRIEWEGDFPDDLRSIVEPVFAPLEALLPTWCQTVVMRNVTSEEYTLQIELSIRNRWALIRVAPGWYTEAHVEREGSFIHELTHALIEPFNWNVSRALDAYGPDEDTAERKFLDQMVRDGLEQATEDTARAIQKSLNLRHSQPAPT